MHVRAELRVVRACGHFRLSVEGDLAHVVVPCGEFRISFTAKHAAYAPRVHINRKTHGGRLVYNLLHGIVIVLQVLFAPCVENGVEPRFFYVCNVHERKLR